MGVQEGSDGAEEVTHLEVQEVRPGKGRRLLPESCWL